MPRPDPRMVTFTVDGLEVQVFEGHENLVVLNHDHPEVAALELVENDALAHEKDIVDAPTVTGRQGHLEETMGHPMDEQKGETDR